MPGMLDHPRSRGGGGFRASTGDIGPRRRVPPTANFSATPSDQGDVIGLEAFFAIDDFDPDPLAGRQRADPAAAQGGDVDEHVLAATVEGNEPVAFVRLEPFDRSLHGRGRPRSAAIDSTGA